MKSKTLTRHQAIWGPALREGFRVQQGLIDKRKDTSTLNCQRTVLILLVQYVLCVIFWHYD